MDIAGMVNTLHPLERKVLPVLKQVSAFADIEKKTGLKDIEVMRALQWLQNKKLIRINQTLKEKIELDENGLAYKEKGVPEKAFLKALEGPTSLSQLEKKSGLNKQEISICLGILKQKNAIDIKKDKELIVSITGEGSTILKKGYPSEKILAKTFPLYVQDLPKEEQAIIKALQQRKKIIKVSVTKIINAELTEHGKKALTLDISDKNVIDTITPNLLKTGEWKGKKLRQYDVTINVPAISGGRTHFVTQAINYIKRIWLDMGFNEMTGNYVQTSFWDLDALFVPQDHPARDEQDTFYLQDPKNGTLPKKWTQDVKKVHEDGGNTGSKGWHYKWSDKIAMENLLRTHTTVLSAQTIAQLQKEDLPAKFFSVGKVFRNEALSWKHLFEFIQVEGIVVDPNANFKHLKGYLKEFFAKMGFPDVRIRPGHFPYTEPSAECDVWHPVKKEWVEVGGAGIFRPEVVKPLLGFDCPVLAWGLGMERTIMEYYQLTDVRDIYKNDIKHLREVKMWMK